MCVFRINIDIYMYFIYMCISYIYRYIYLYVFCKMTRLVGNHTFTEGDHVCELISKSTS